MRQRKTIDPCPVCRMHRTRCICAFIPRLELKTKLSLFIHHRELKRTTNTGQLAVAALVNSEMYVRGLGPVELQAAAGYEDYLLFPSDDAVDISLLRPTRPVRLIVADGNWRQAGKVHRRHAELRQVPRVKINEVNLGMGHLRREHFVTGFSTLEAIAIALGYIEGSEVRDKLLALYCSKLRATMLGRGRS
jgi:DTW domain-containing protein YfiP